jgi:hypothetical protein
LLSTKNKSIATVIIAVTLAVSLVALPALITVKADLTWYPYLTASPDTIGVGQRVLVVFGFTMPTMSAVNSFNDWTLTITDPDGNVQTLSGFNTESTGSTYHTFIPDKTGTWKLKAHYPGGWAILGRGTGYNVTVPATDTNEFSVTVQEEQIPEISNEPLPTDYWTFPIYGENRAWNTIGGNWLMSGYDAERNFDAGAQAYNPYTTVPETSHILWTKSQLFGGIVGGPTEMTYYTGSAYRRELLPPVVINGRMFYSSQDPPRMGFYSVDLTNGETVWFNNATYPDGKGGLIQGADARITLGQVLTFETMNWHGGLPFLWSTGSSTTWAVWNAWTSELIFTIGNATTGGTFFIHQPTGTLLFCKIDAVNDKLLLWNSTKFFSATVSTDLNGFYNAGPRYNLDWNAGVQLNETIPHIEGQAIAAWDPKDYSVIVASNQSSYRGTPLAGEPFLDIAYSLEDGNVRWQKLRDEGTFESITGGRAMSIEDDCYVIVRKETRQVYAYSVSTGEKKWVSEPRPDQWGMYFTGQNFAYGKCYVIAYDGMVYAYDTGTGKVEWTWGPVDAGLETPYDVYPFFGGSTLADHKIIVSHGEHSANSPLYRGERMYVIDADNGTTVWSISGWYQQAVAANGLVIAPNGYDGRIYCFGKGPSKTTIQAPLTQIDLGDTITITGTVTDQSPGAKDTAAVSDESMSQWMEHLYMQKSAPTNATGVTVSIDVIDANGNFRNIGSTTSDVSGVYSFVWEPDIPGKFTVIATFAGSEAYGSSYAETAFNVVDVPQADSEPIVIPQAPVELYFAASTIAIIIALAIVALLLLRKRP